MQRNGSVKFVAAVAVVLFGLAYPAVTSAAEAKTVMVKTQRGVSQPFLFASPDSPTAGLILFVGGHGALRLSDSGLVTKLKNDFLVRAYKGFVENGFMVALVDVPSDIKKFSVSFRITGEHAADMISVIGFMENTARVPIWAVGTSMGTISAANVAINNQQRVSGLVLTSTITRTDQRS